ncbi:MAG: superfamily II DNA or RNA helicase [Hyphomicrobiaceae bacterium]|jgi:superfamily II DNA or RNA helicase
MDWNALLQTAQEECPVGLWSKGTGLARQGAVRGESRTEKEWTFRVRTPGDTIAPTVSLFPQDQEWDCDCDGPFDPCQHVAAALCAIAQANDGGASLFDSDGAATNVRHELVGSPEGLGVLRFVVTENAPPHAINEPLDELVKRPGVGEGLTPTRADLAADRILRRCGAPPLSFEHAIDLLAALVGAPDVRLNGKPVETSREPLFPRASITDSEQGGVELLIEPDPLVDEIVAPGVLRRKNTLHPFGARNRFGEFWERLPLRKHFSPSAYGELVGSVLPELERWITVEITSQRLPGRVSALPPWIKFEIDFIGGGIDVLPLLVYADPPTARVDGGKFIHLGGDLPARDEAAEQHLLLRLRQQLNLIPGRRVQFAPADAARFLSDVESFDDGRGRKRIESIAAYSPRAKLVPRLVVDGDGFELTFDVEGSSGESESAHADAQTVVGAWQDGFNAVPLSDGQFASVPEAWLQAHGHLVADLLAAKAASDGNLPTAALPVLAELCDAMEAPPPPEMEKLRALLTPVDFSTAATPPDFVGELRNYQAAGVAWLTRLRDAGLGAVLADDMGLGKTVQALCVLRGRTLVVCPRSVIHNWRNEVQRFRPSLDIGLYHGPGRTLGEEAITLTTYATLRNDIEILADLEWDCVVLDEAQAIKNPDSQVARAAYRLEAKFRISLSGTPIENRPSELWSQIHFTNRGLLGGRSHFVERYEKPMFAGDEDAATRLRERVAPFLLRRLKRDVARELPPRTDAVMICELDDRERALYESVRAAARADVVRRLDAGSAGGRNVMAALEALLRMRQAACHSGLLPGQEAEGSSKVEALCEALDDVVADGHKALVFSQWTGLLDRVEPALTARGITFTRLDGSTRDRESVVASFQDDAGPPVLLISLKAGGTGLNLTAADHVFLLDPWWNPAVEDQAADRAHRIGQERPVMVYRLVAKDTVEERVLDLQDRKRRIAAAALAAGDPSGGLTQEDILSLLD